MNPFEQPQAVVAVAVDRDAEMKTRFAIALLKNPDQPFVAGTEVFGADTGRALRAAAEWINDPFVLSEQTRLLKEKGARSFLPSREDYAREVWRRAMDSRTPSDDSKYLLSLYGDVMGFKQQAEKPGVTVNNITNKVMLVTDHGTDAEWEAKAKAQQAAMQREAVLDVPSRAVH